MMAKVKFSSTGEDDIDVMRYVLSICDNGSIASDGSPRFLFLLGTPSLASIRVGIEVEG